MEAQEGGTKSKWIKISRKHHDNLQEELMCWRSRCKDAEHKLSQVQECLHGTLVCSACDEEQ